jgi:hypothetical protein
MSTVRKKCLPFLAAVAALGIQWAAPSALAQSSPAPSSVLPTGGGQGLIDPSDSVMLLLDHQTGLAGFKVYAMIDASGDPSDLASRTTLARFTQAGVIPTFNQRCTVGGAPPGGLRARQALRSGGAQLRGHHRELQQGARGRQTTGTARAVACLDRKHGSDRHASG